MSCAHSGELYQSLTEAVCLFVIKEALILLPNFGQQCTLMIDRAMCHLIPYSRTSILALKRYVDFYHLYLRPGYGKPRAAEVLHCSASCSPVADRCFTVDRWRGDDPTGGQPVRHRLMVDSEPNSKRT